MYRQGQSVSMRFFSIFSVFSKNSLNNWFSAVSMAIDNSSPVPDLTGMGRSEEKRQAKMAAICIKTRFIDVAEIRQQTSSRSRINDLRE